MWRSGVALALVFAFSGGPLALDQCDATCAEARAAAAVDGPSADPICHREQTPPASRISGVVDPCGHDHTGSDRAAIGEAPRERLRTAPLIAAVVTQAPAVVAFLRTDRARPHPTSPPGSVTRTLASALRI